MRRDDLLATRYPAIGRRLRRLPLADLPTPVRRCSLTVDGVARELWVKHDDRTSELYGGNKVRKLEYLLARTEDRGKHRVATFGAISSNHALATAMFAKRRALQPVCFLAHQTRTPLAAVALNMHLKLGTELIEYGGNYAERIGALRRHVQDRDTDVIPMGGSSWTGCVGFLDAGLELAAQIESGLLPAPARIYLASGTLGSAAGLALGLKLAGLDSTVHAVRVSHQAIASEAVLERLLQKTALMLGRIERTFPASLADTANVTMRHAYFEPGYARSNPGTDEAIAIAGEQLSLKLEPTYTGKAMAALIDDLRTDDGIGDVLFWNTYNSVPLPVDRTRPDDVSALPDAFLSYFD